MKTAPHLDRAREHRSSLRDHLDHLLEVSTRAQSHFCEGLSEYPRLIDERNLLQTLIDHVPVVLFIKDTSSTFVVANEATAATKRFVATGEPVTAAALIGKTDFDLFPPEMAQKYREAELQLMHSGQPMIDMEYTQTDGNGRSRCLSLTKLPLRDANSHVIGLIAIGQDVTERKQAEARVKFLAHHDSLTNLPNRSVFADRLSQAVLNAKRTDARVTVIFVDLDKFKLINDSLGHLAGDSLLKIMAGRMAGCLRSTDTVARLGGDEFVILLNDAPKEAEGLTQIIDKIRSSIAAPVQLTGQQFTPTTSMGVASFPEDGTDPEELLAHADAAMYRAKELGRDNFQFYSAAMTASIAERLSLLEGLRRAIVADEFVLHYQPQIDLKTSRIFAVEALVRWRHPSLGLLLPGKFIQLAEETGLIIPIGKWVIETACAQNAQWQREGLAPITISVNVSARQFSGKELVGHVKSALLKSGLAAAFLELELTESMIMQDQHRAVATMQELEAIGVRLSIDDFGTGYSSLSALKTFPLTRLKIDQSFVKGLSSDDDDRAIAAAIISLGQKLKLRVMAEGVESGQQLEFLQENGCDEVQGFHFSKAIGPDDLANLLREQEGARSPR